MPRQIKSDAELLAECEALDAVYANAQAFDIAHSAPPPDEDGEVRGTIRPYRFRLGRSGWSSMSSFIERRLERVERELEDLTDYLNRQLRKCRVCDSYHTEDLIGRTAAREIEETLERVRRWQSEPWAKE